MQSKKIILFVEGEIQKIIIQNILIAAQYPIDAIEITVAGGKSNVIKFAKNQSKTISDNTIVGVFVNADTVYIQQAIGRSLSDYEKMYFGISKQFTGQIIDVAKFG